MKQQIVSGEHPLHIFRFCPKCGAEDFRIHDFKSKKCDRCGFTFYGNASAAAAALILDRDNRLLVVRRAFEPAKGTLDLPGGFIDPEETAEEAIRREIREETGVEVVNPEYLFSVPNLYPYSGMNIHTVDLIFRCRIDSLAGIRAGDDASEAFFLEKPTVRPEDFGLTSIRDTVRKWMTFY